MRRGQNRRDATQLAAAAASKKKKNQLKDGVNDEVSVNDNEADFAKSQGDDFETSESCDEEQSIEVVQEKPEQQKEDEKEDVGLGLTDLEKAYRDILNEPISPTTIGGMKSFITAFKPWA